MRTTRFSLALLALLSGMPVLTGCGKDPLPPKVLQEITHEQAQRVASQAGEALQGGGAMSQTRSLILRSAVRPGMAARSAGARRAHGVLAADDGSFTFDIQAYDADGHLLDWETSPDENIARFHESWSWHWSESDAAGNNFLWGMRGVYDVTGFQASASVYDFAGTAEDTLRWHWVSQGEVSDMNGIWDQADDHVAWSKAADAAPYPLSGTSGYTVDESWSTIGAGTKDQGAIRCSVQVTYNGTHLAGMLVDGRYRFQLDLDTGTATPLAS